MLQDYTSIVQSDCTYYTSLNFTEEELINYDKNITYFNSKVEDFQEYRDKIVVVIKDLLHKCESSLYSNNKILASMIIFKLLETDFGEIIIQNYPKFRAVVFSKLKEFKNDNNFPKFQEYLNENYDIGKKYISKYQNKRYNLRRLRTILFTFYVFLSRGFAPVRRTCENLE